MEAPGKKANGKGLVWNNDELLAVAHAAPKVCLDPSVGKCMTRRVIGDKLKEELVSSSLRPSDARTKHASKDRCDRRRWNLRTPKECYHKWIVMR